MLVLSCRNMTIFFKGQCSDLFYCFNYCDMLLQSSHSLFYKDVVYNNRGLDLEFNGIVVSQVHLLKL